jgi:hypothetical protein
MPRNLNDLSITDYPDISNEFKKGTPVVKFVCCFSNFLNSKKFEYGPGTL